MCVTNDWFTGLVAAYGRSGSNANIFLDTCFLHICHNLSEHYEGRIYFEEEEKDEISEIH